MNLFNITFINAKLVTTKSDIKKSTQYKLVIYYKYKIY